LKCSSKKAVKNVIGLPRQALSGFSLL